jgi:ParB family chromosome partitioning protein
MNASTKPQGRKFQIIPVKDLTIAPDNIRKTPATKEEDKELKASIRAQGVVQPLIVKPGKGKGKFFVHAGGRRLEQTQALLKEKALPANTALACVVLPANVSATEISMIENMLHARMHPIDEYEAFHKLHFADGVSIKEIALHFGRTEHNVKKTLALGGAHAELRMLCREGKIPVEALQAYAATEDKEKQLDVYKALLKKGNWATRRPDEIRELLITNTYTDRDKIVKCIGIKNYQERGGRTSTDLFQGETILHDPALVEIMLKEKLDATTTQVLAEGWSWAVADLEYREYSTDFSKQKPKVETTPAQTKELKKLEAQEKKLDAELNKLNAIHEEDVSAAEYAAADDRAEQVRELLEDIENKKEIIEHASAVFTDKQKAAGGCVVTIDSSGNLSIVRGLIKAADKKKAENKKQKTSSSSPDADHEAADFSLSVKADLAAWHLAAAKAELLYNHELMYTLMQFSICWSLFTNADLSRFGGEPGPLHFSLAPHESFSDSTLHDIEDSRMHQELFEYRKTLNLDWLHDSIEESWKAFRLLDAQDVQRLVGYCATLTLRGKSFMSDADETPFIDLLLQGIGARLAKHWRPSAECFFQRVPLSTIHAAGVIMDGGQHQKNIAGLKGKKALANYMGERLKSNQAGTHHCWLPEGFLYHTLGEEPVS